MYVRNKKVNELASRWKLHIKVCEVYGDDEIYYVDSKTSKQIGISFEDVIT